MAKSQEKRRLYLWTFIAISAAILIIGFIGVTYSISNIKEKYVNQQLESNKRTAEVVSEILADKLESGISEKKVLESFQKAIAGSQVNEGYLCMFDAKKSVLVCHPDSSAIGKKIEGQQFQFQNLRENREELFENAVSSSEQEGGVLSMQEPARSEITYMAPVPGTHWKVSVHENLDKIEANLANLDKAKTDFLGIISHELRTPLNGIIGFSDILEQELNQEEHLEFVQNIKQSGRRLINFSETAMLITELSSNYMELKFEKVKAGVLFDEVRKEYEERLQEKGITLTKDEQQPDKELKVAPNLIKKCFANILDNAITYTPEGGEIKIDSYIYNNDDYIFEMRDTGPGFSEEAQNKLFDFFGSDDVMHHKEGFGLGLAASKLIMEAHSGRIDIDNCESGAKVTVSFINQNSS